LLNSAVQGFAVGSVWVPMTMVAFDTLAAKDRAEASSVFHLLRNIGSSFFISLSIAEIVRTTGANYSRMSEMITPFNPALTMPNMTGMWNFDTVRGLAKLAAEINRQSAMIGYLNAFICTPRHQPSRWCSCCWCAGAAHLELFSWHDVPRSRGAGHGYPGANRARVGAAHELFGREAVEKRMSAFGEFGKPLQHVINAYAYGDVWQRSAPAACGEVARHGRHDGRPRVIRMSCACI
jgi:hypothetical protein